jgi:hypothetical protein
MTLIKNRSVLIAVLIAVSVSVAVSRLYAGGICIAIVVCKNSGVRRNTFAVRIGWNVGVRLYHALARRIPAIAVVSIHSGISVVRGAAAG